MGWRNSSDGGDFSWGTGTDVFISVQKTTPEEIWVNFWNKFDDQYNKGSSLAVCLMSANRELNNKEFKVLTKYFKGMLSKIDDNDEQWELLNKLAEETK